YPFKGFAPERINGKNDRIAYGNLREPFIFIDFPNDAQLGQVDHRNDRCPGIYMSSDRIVYFNDKPGDFTCHHFTPYKEKWSVWLYEISFLYVDRIEKPRRGGCKVY